MATEIVMPKLGWTMEEGTLTEWKKNDGDEVTPGEIYMLVESDKALNEIESFEAGVLRILPDGPKVGDVVKVGTVLGYLVAKGEPAPFEQPKPSSAPANIVAAQPSAGVIAEAYSAVPNRRDGVPRISPRALRVAAELGVDWKRLTGSGTSARILERDVRAVAVVVAQQAKPAATENLAITQVSTAAGSNPIRKLTAQRMTASAHTTAPVTLTTEIDATELVKLRDVLKAGGKQPLPSFTDLFARIVALSLAGHPQLNASWQDDRVVLHDVAHIGIAVQTDRALLVPVVRNPAGKTLSGIASESAALIAQARAGTLPAAAMQGGTFTITNLGMYGIDAFTPIINLPECAILGLGRIVPKLIVIDAAAEKTAIRNMLLLSLTFDHRVVDGAPAAQFLKTVRTNAEQPYLWLAG